MVCFASQGCPPCPCCILEDAKRRICYTVGVAQKISEDLLLGAVSRADIKPSKYIPFWWCILPPTPEQLRGLYKLGANRWAAPPCCAKCCLRIIRVLWQA